MVLTYWQKRDAAKETISRDLRVRLMERYVGVPVIVLRTSADKIRADNKTWVAEVLKHYDCEDFAVSWRVLFNFSLDEDRVARVSDFTVTAEGT